MGHPERCFGYAQHDNSTSLRIAPCVLPARSGFPLCAGMTGLAVTGSPRGSSATLGTTGGHPAPPTLTPGPSPAIGRGEETP